MKTIVVRAAIHTLGHAKRARKRLDGAVPPLHHALEPRKPNTMPKTSARLIPAAAKTTVRLAAARTVTRNESASIGGALS